MFFPLGGNYDFNMGRMTFELGIQCVSKSCTFIHSLSCQPALKDKMVIFISLYAHICNKPHSSNALAME